MIHNEESLVASLTCLNQFSVIKQLRAGLRQVMIYTKQSHVFHASRAQKRREEKKRLNHRSYEPHFHTRYKLVLERGNFISKWEFHEFNAANSSQVIRFIQLYIHKTGRMTLQISEPPPKKKSFFGFSTGECV